MTSLSDIRQMIHPFPPVIAADACCLILGTFPSVKSVADGYYYANPANRFYAVLSALFQDDVCALDWTLKREWLIRHRLALYDVIESCTIHGSSDAMISDIHPANLESLLNQAPIRRIFCNGKRAYVEYKRYFSHLNVPVTLLPSTSPANAKIRLPELIHAWHILVESI